VNVVWESWCLPRHSFILWLALLKRLQTKDRLYFVDIDVSCVFCQDYEENHDHLFFACSWTSILWMKVKSWLKLNRGMTTINSAVLGLHLKGKSVVTRMKRVSLSIVVYLIWDERNRRVFENSCSLVEPIFLRFQVLFYMILRFHQHDIPFLIDWLLTVMVILSFGLHYDGLFWLFLDATAPIEFLSCCFDVHGCTGFLCMIGCISTSFHGRDHDLLLFSLAGLCFVSLHGWLPPHVSA